MEERLSDAARQILVAKPPQSALSATVASSEFSLKRWQGLYCKVPCICCNVLSIEVVSTVLVSNYCQDGRAVQSWEAMESCLDSWISEVTQTDSHKSSRR